MLAEVHLALEAMGTRFELLIAGADLVHLRAAGEEALAEIGRLDCQLSLYNRASDISWINAHAADGPVVVEPRLFDLLEGCQRMSSATDGAFDITIGPLMRAWRFIEQNDAVRRVPPAQAALDAARQAVGFEHVQLDPVWRTVQFTRRGMVIDLGAAGKGYAIDVAVAVLREQGVSRALIHGGTSSVHGLGHSAEGTGWQIGWDAPGAPRRRFELRDGALSVSATRGKAFTADGREYGHIMDARTGSPATSARAAIVTGPGSFECDALSTALLVRGASWVPVLRDLFDGYDGAAA